MNKLSIKLFVIIAAFHGILSYFLLFKSLSIPLRSLCAQASSSEKVVSLLSDIMLYPIFMPMIKWNIPFEKIFPGYLVHIPIILNSLVWAYCILVVINKLKRFK